MKKIVKSLFLMAALILGLAGCSSKKTNSEGWYESFDDAKAIAKSNDKSILLLVDSFFSTPESKNAVFLMTKSKDFVSKLDNCVCVFFDFTDYNLMQNRMPVNLTDEEQKAFERKRKIIVEQQKVADYFAIRTTPAMFLLTKEGYFAANVNIDYSSTSVEGIVAKIKQEAESVEEVEKLVKAISGSNSEKIKAIDALFEYTPEIYRPALFDLFKDVPDMDKKNKTGLATKYIREVANVEAFDFLIKSDFDSAAKVYEKAAEDSRNTAEDKQKLYSMEATVYQNPVAPNPNRVLELLKKAIDCAPETSEAKAMEKYIEVLKSELK